MSFPSNSLVVDFILFFPFQTSGGFFRKYYDISERLDFSRMETILPLVPLTVGCRDVQKPCAQIHSRSRGSERVVVKKEESTPNNIFKNEKLTKIHSRGGHLAPSLCPYIGVSIYLLPFIP